MDDEATAEYVAKLERHVAHLERRVRVLEEAILECCEAECGECEGCRYHMSKLSTKPYVPTDEHLAWAKSVVEGPRSPWED